MPLVSRAVALQANVAVNVREVGEESVSIFPASACFIVNEGDVNSNDGSPVPVEGVTVRGLKPDDGVWVLSAGGQTIKVLGIS